MYPECMTESQRVVSTRAEAPGELHKVTVNLTQKSWDAANETAALLGLSRTDVINRALQAYAWLEQQAADGAEVLVQQDGETDRVKFL